jgi:hypothetical protein
MVFCGSLKTGCLNFEESLVLVVIWQVWQIVGVAKAG